MADEYILIKETVKPGSNLPSFEVRESLYSGDGLWAEVFVLQRGNRFAVMTQNSINPGVHYCGVNLGILESSLVNITDKPAKAHDIAYDCAVAIAKERAGERRIGADGVLVDGFV